MGSERALRLDENRSKNSDRVRASQIQAIRKPFGGSSSRIILAHSSRTAKPVSNTTPAFDIFQLAPTDKRQENMGPTV